MKKILIKNGTIVEESGMRKADVLISVTGEIEAIEASIQNHKDTETIDATDQLLFPLLIDCHVHFREPGLEHKATMETEALAALAGGVGTVCEMPNTIPPTVTIATLADKVRRASHIDGCVIKFFFGVTEAIHLQALRDLWTGSSMELKRLKHHCAGVKVYFDHSTGDLGVDTEILEDIFRVSGELKIPLVAHCEDPTVNAEMKKRITETDIGAHSKLRPPESEGVAIERAIGLARKFKAPLHIAHLSTSDGIELVRAAKKEKLPVTCEVAPHHLFLTTDDYKKLGTLGKMNPPLRDKEHQKALWEGIFDQTVDCISTDHAPHTLEEKRRGTSLASDVPSGVPGVEMMVPLLLSVASGHWPHPNAQFSMGNAQFTYKNIIRLCFTNPNRIFSLHQELIKIGAKARILIIDPNASWTVERANLKTKCGWSPYEGWEIHGKVQRVIF